MWGSGNLSGVFSGVQGPCLYHHTPALFPDLMAARAPDSAEMQVREVVNAGRAETRKQQLS